MKVRLGPCFQTRNLGPQCGENWFNAYYDDLYYTGLGLGRGVQAIRNPSWDLLVYFTPRPGRTHTVVDRYLENPYRCSPVQMRQVWSGMVRAGEELTFTSVLLPHAPTFTPKDLLDPPADSKDPRRIEVLQDDDHVTVVQGDQRDGPVEQDPLGDLGPAERHRPVRQSRSAGKRCRRGRRRSRARRDDPEPRGRGRHRAAIPRPRRMARGQEAATGAGGDAGVGWAQTYRIQFCRASR